MRRDLWLKQWCTGCCRKIHPISILSHTKTRFRHSDHPDAYSHTQTYKCKRTHVHSICRAFVLMLSCSTFEYNFLYWHCWRELSKQLSRPLLWLRSEHWAVGWRQQESRRGWFSVSTRRPVSILERRSMAVKYSSDHQRPRLRKAAWPETATKSTFLAAAAECLDFCVNRRFCCG